MKADAKRFAPFEREGSAGGDVRKISRFPLSRNLEHNRIRGKWERLLMSTAERTSG
jgi:hypothetical protein